MARIVGGFMGSQVPALGRAIARNLQGDAGFKPWFDGLPPVRHWLAEVKPDVAVLVYNDHGLNFFLDQMPTFAVGAAREYRNADEGWELPVLPPFEGDVDLSWHLIESLVRDEFDLTICQEMRVDHAFTLPMAMLWPGQGAWPVRTVPVCVNTVQHPLPTAARCWKLGEAIGRAVEAWPPDARVVVIGSGGLSYQLDGECAGIVNQAFDRRFIESLVADPRWATRYTNTELVDRAGTQGVELLMWLVTRAALTGRVTKLHANYHVPISSRAAAQLLLDNLPLG